MKKMKRDDAYAIDLDNVVRRGHGKYKGEQNGSLIYEMNQAIFTGDELVKARRRYGQQFK